MNNDFISITVSKKVATRELMIDHILNGVWSNKTWDRDDSIYVEGDDVAVILRFERSNDGFILDAVVQHRVNADDWDDASSECLYKGAKWYIDELITDEYFNGLIPLLIKIHQREVA